MNFQILPNWCKKLGILMFVLFSFIVGSGEFMRGWKSFDNPNYNEPHFFEEVFSPVIMDAFDTLTMIGLLIYMLSKEKIEDEYIKTIRLESYQLTTIIAISLSIILYIISKKLKLSLDYFILLYMFMYLIIFGFRKRREI